jgi:hypothetical protein
MLLHPGSRKFPQRRKETNPESPNPQCAHVAQMCLDVLIEVSASLEIPILVLIGQKRS